MIVKLNDLERANRLKSERKKFQGLTQKGAALIANVSEQSWVRFEKRGEPFDLRFVELLEAYGFDMMYVIFGIAKTVKPDQLELIGLYEKANESQKIKIIQMVRLMSEPE